MMNKPFIQPIKQRAENNLHNETRRLTVNVVLSVSSISTTIYYHTGILDIHFDNI